MGVWGVMYRLVSRATVEERMMQASRRKLETLVLRHVGKGTRELPLAPLLLHPHIHLLHLRTAVLIMIYWHFSCIVSHFNSHVSPTLVQVRKMGKGGAAAGDGGLKQVG